MHLAIARGRQDVLVELSDMSSTRAGLPMNLADFFAVIIDRSIQEPRESALEFIVHDLGKETRHVIAKPPFRVQILVVNYPRSAVNMSGRCAAARSPGESQQ